MKVDLYVEVMRRYTKIFNLPKVANRLLGPGAARRKSDDPIFAANVVRTSTAQRLGPEVVTEMVRQFLAGTPKTKLAEQYDVSLSTMKRLLREHRAA